MWVADYKDREEIDVTLEGTKGAKMRWLIDKSVGAQRYAMRLFEIQPGGEIPLHHHPEEHEIFVLEGDAEVFNDVEVHYVTAGNILYVPPNEPHGYKNVGNKPFRFICVIPYLDNK